MYDLEHHIYTDAVIQGRLNWNEHSALQEMVDRSDISKALVVADRGYESYNNMAHIQEKDGIFNTNQGWEKWNKARLGLT